MTGTLFLWFDDLRDAMRSHETFGMILSTSESGSISHHQYFEQDCANPKARAISAYDGQVEFVAHFTGQVLDFNLGSIYEAVSNYAKSLGEVRTFALQHSSSIAMVQFRAEYFKLSSAETAMRMGDIPLQIHVSVASCHSEAKLHG